MNPGQVEQFMQLAVQHVSAGRLPEAEAIYRQVIAFQPGRIDAIKSLGNLLRMCGRCEEALSEYGRALELQPEDPEIYINLGVTLTDLGRLEEAVALLSRLIAFLPDLAVAYSNRGIVLRKLGRIGEAIADYRRAVQIQPTYFEAHFNLGNALREVGELESAASSYVLALRLNPGSTALCNNLGITLAALGRTQEAIAAHQQAVGIDGLDPRSYNNLGNVLRDAGQLDEASAAYLRALEIKPDYAMAHRNLGNVLRDQGRPGQALAAYRRAAELQPQDPSALSNVIYALEFHPERRSEDIAKAQQNWNRQYSKPLERFIQPFTNDRDPGRRLRIGYVSADFREHTIGRSLLPLFQNHERREYEIVCYSGVLRKDAVTEQYRQLCDLWRDVAGLSDEALAAQIRKDGVDILVDLTQHLSGNRLAVFARKPAPVAVSFAGYPAGTGLPAIPYRISDRFLEAGRAHGEQVFLTESFWCYDPCGAGIPVNELPAREGRVVTFGCLNNFAKINEPVLNLWAQVLRKVERSRIVFLAPAGSHRDWVRNVLNQHGVDSSRVDFAETRPRRNYLELYHSVDIALDPFPYNGHTTSLDALWMGVPVVSLAGVNPVARGGVSILGNIGLPELIAYSVDEYVRIAAKLAGDLDALRHLRATLRSRMEASPLMNARRFARNIEAAYRNMWRQWCGGPQTA